MRSESTLTYPGEKSVIIHLISALLFNKVYLKPQPPLLQGKQPQPIQFFLITQALKSQHHPCGSFLPVVWRPELQIADAARLTA